jgi:hypothetical protein
MIDLSYIIPHMKTNTKQATTKDMENLLDEDYKETMQGRTEERKNRFNGQSVMLTKEEARRHDCIFLAEIAATINDKTVGHGASKHWDIMREHLDWFRKNNAKAYMVLLD